MNETFIADNAPYLFAHDRIVVPDSCVQNDLVSTRVDGNDDGKEYDVSSSVLLVQPNLLGNTNLGSYRHTYLASKKQKY